MPRVVLIAFAASLATACTPPATKIAASVEYDDAWQLESLLIKVDGETRSIDAADELTFEVPQDTAGSPLTLEIWGLVGGASKKAYGRVDVTPLRDDTVDTTLALKLLDCSSPCNEGATRCDGDAGVVTCLRIEGCGVWSQTVDCPTGAPFCSGGICAATCADECTMGTVQCDGSGATKTCGQADADSCVEWQPAAACPAMQTCSANACRPVITCDNPLPNWKKENPVTVPTARYESTMAYDVTRSKVVLFGGYNNSGLLGDTWTWDGSTWNQESPATSPPARFGAAMVYDTPRRNVVLFGGLGNGNLGDTWTWNGSTWKQELPATAPQARNASTMAYDASRSNVVLFGGYITSMENQGDTWTWNGATWKQESPAILPPVRNGATMAYDASRSEVVLFGGDDQGNLDDTWTWNGASWTRETPSTTPPKRRFSSMAYDASRSNVVLFGGNSGIPLSDTWTWNGTDWKQEPFTTSPPARQYAAMAYDRTRNKVVLFGGYNGAPLNDTWTLEWTCP